MKTLRISVDQISEYSYLEFGERGENAVTEVILDFASWVEEFGEGIVNLYVKRGGDTSAYPVPLSVDGTVATWIVSETDTYKRGRGEAEYVYVVGEKIEKTAVFGFYVRRDIGQPSTTPPSPYETWLETLMELSNTTLQNAQDAEESAEKAETASKHYPVIVDNYWWVWRVEEEAYVNTGVKAEGKDFTIKGTVATVADLPSEAEQGDFWNVGTHEPYTMYMYQVGEGWINQGSLKGPTGTTFIPSVSEAGVISWTNDGDLPNPEPRNIRGPQGEQGVKGEAGDSAGFGTPTATVDQTIGQASVSVSASGPDTAKVFNFEFSGIKGETGNGITGVSLVSTSGLDKTYRITFAETSPFEFVVHDGRGISSVVLNADYTLTINFTDGTNWTTPNSIRGEKGETGQKGETGTTFTPSVSSDGVISWTNDGGKSNPSPVNIKGPQGLKGDTGDAAGFGTPVASVDSNVGTPSVTVTASGPDTAKVFDFQFRNMKGQKGDPGQDAPDDYVLVQSTEPTSETNKIWINAESGSRIQVPTWAEHQELAEEVSNQKSAIDEVVKRVTYPQLLNKAEFIDGKSLVTTALVATPEDMVDDPNHTVTNLIELTWPATDGNRVFETNLKTGEFQALGYYYREAAGNYVRSGNVSTCTAEGDHYKFSMPATNVKMRITLRTLYVDPKDVIITKAGEWTTDPTYGTDVPVVNDGLVRMSSLDEELSEMIDPVNPCHYNGDSVRAFKKFVCIGDSLTEGTFDYNDSGTNKTFVDADYSYPTIFAAITGKDVTNKGDGGETFASWYSQHSGDDLSGHDCAIIELGLNDSTQNTTSADRLAAMGNIVTKLKTENPGIKIFFSTIFPCYSNSHVGEVNEDIINFVDETQDCWLLNLTDYSDIQVGTAYVAGHLTAIGYEKLSREYANYISCIIDGDKNSFKFIQYIGTNKQYA